MEATLAELLASRSVSLWVAVASAPSSQRGTIHCGSARTPPVSRARAGITADERISRGQSLVQRVVDGDGRPRVCVRAAGP
jgi:hypothetical protein